LSNVTVTFCGHRDVNDKRVKEELYKAISEILLPLSFSDKVTFLCGGYGVFDCLCSTVIDEIRAQGVSPTVEKIFVTPYITESYKERIEILRPHYDGVVFPPIEGVPLRFAIPRRNQWMVEQADIVIAYVTHGFGGAATTLSYAYQKKKKIVRLISDYEV